MGAGWIVLGSCYRRGLKRRRQSLIISKRDDNERFVLTYRTAAIAVIVNEMGWLSYWLPMHDVDKILLILSCVRLQRRNRRHRSTPGDGPTWALSQSFALNGTHRNDLVTPKRTASLRWVTSSSLHVHVNGMISLCWRKSRKRQPLCHCYD